MLEACAMSDLDAELSRLRAENESLRERLAGQVRVASYQSERFEFLTAALPQQLWTALPTGQLDYVNPRVTEFFGRSAAQIIGDGWKDYLHPDDVEPCIQRWVHSLTTGEPYEFEFRLRRFDGVFRWHIARALCQRGADQQLLRWYGTNTDVSELKEAKGAGSAR